VILLAFPWDSNPYQRLLYGEMEKLGAQVRYAGRLTPSHTLNVLLLPLELAVWRLKGARLVHLHWVFGFAFTGADRFPALRHLAQAWFLLWLWTIHVLRMRLIWTAHNVLPHDRVFANDIAARVALVRRSDLVVTHGDHVVPELASLGAVPRRSMVVRHGPFLPTQSVSSLRVPGSSAGPRHLLFFGRVHAQKGVEDLLTAFLGLPDKAGCHLTVAGECRDLDLRSRLEAAVAERPSRVTLRLQHVPDDEVTSLLSSADAVVLPFRQVTTSGSAVLALCHGRPVILPDLQSLRDIPEAATIRYDGSVASLQTALLGVASARAEKLRAMSVAAFEWADPSCWTVAAQCMMAQIRHLSGDYGQGQTTPYRHERARSVNGQDR
jgi:glycosyltransferase involved in cell wall biosynthesis